jgi:hypothetical protein
MEGALPIEHRELSLHDRICHTHFAEKDFRKDLKIVVGGKDSIRLST